jgi:competence ComEA-like helix-hairpin-helix protein
MGAIIFLLLAAAVWLGWTSSRPRIGFVNQPPPQARRVRAAEERIDPNTASQASMLRLYGIGPVKARKIIDYRTAHGPDAFKAAGDLMNIRGFGPVTIHRIASELSLPQ